MTSTNADVPVPPVGQADHGSSAASGRSARSRSRGLAWLLLIVSALLELVWATGLAASEGFSQPIPAVVFVIALIASAAALAYAIRTVRVVAGFVWWGVISALMTGIWALLTGVNIASVVSVAVLAVVLGLAVGLHLLFQRRTQATS